jgi:hypothetical protein
MLPAAGPRSIHARRARAQPDAAHVRRVDHASGTPVHRFGVHDVGGVGVDDRLLVLGAAPALRGRDQPRADLDAGVAQAERGG